MTSLVAIVGAGRWSKVSYVINQKKFETDFATHALYELLKEKFSFEKFLFFGTDESNWDVVKKYFGNDYERVIIPEGKNEKEVKEIVNSFIEHIPEGEVLLDLTHGFRHHQMLLLLISFYLSQLRKSKIVHGYYGMLPHKATEAEFIDLSVYFTILESFFGAEVFRDTFYSYRLQEIEEKLEKVIREEFHQKPLMELRKVIRGIISLSESLKINFAAQAIEKAENMLPKIENSKEIMKEEMPYILPSIEIYSNEIKRIAELKKDALWSSLSKFSEVALKKERYVSSMITLREGVLTYGCFYLSKCKNKECKNGFSCSDVELREKISGTLNMIARNEMVSPRKEVGEVAKIYSDIQQLRNLMSHAFIRKDPPSIREIKSKIEDFQTKYREIISDTQ